MLGFCSTWGLLGECGPGRCGASVLKGPGPGGKRGGLVRTGTLVGCLGIARWKSGGLVSRWGSGQERVGSRLVCQRATGRRARGPVLRLDKGGS